MEEKCDICDSDLYMTVKDEAWCPQCEGITPLSKRDSLMLCDSLLKDLDDEIDFYCSFFSFDSLIYAGYESREIRIKGYKEDLYISWDIKDIIWATLLIKRALKGPCGTENKPGFRLLLTPIFQDFYDFISLNNDKILIEEGYGDFFEYSADIKAVGETHPYYSSDKNKFYVFIPKASWLKYLNNLEEGNVARKPTLEKVAEKSFTRNTAATPEERRYRLFEMINNSFHYVYYNAEMFTFSEIDYKNKEALEFFTEITDLALEEAKNLVKTSVVKISKDKFFEIAAKYANEPNELFEMFVSSKSDIKEFPILVEHDDEIVLCPETMFLIRGILEYQFNKDNLCNIISGHQFEKEIQLQLHSLGYKTDDPLQKGAHLMGRKIKITDPDTETEQEREIDIIAYNDSTLLVIECKEWRLAPKILWKYQQQYRVDDIEEEIDQKHLARYEYVKDNYKDRFGFEEDYEVKGMLITRIKEDIDEYKGIKIVSRNELDEDLTI